MKKILATILALTMVLSLGAIAFAAEGGPGESSVNISGSDVSSLENNNYQINIQLDGDVEPTPAAAYYVTVAWQSMEFTFTPGTAKSGWQGADHSYQNGATEGTWSNGGSSTITITNHSNVGVTVNASYTGENGFTTTGSSSKGVTVTCAGLEGQELAAGEEGKPTEAKSVTCDVTVTGTPTEKITALDVGYVAINISAASGD